MPFRLKNEPLHSSELWNTLKDIFFARVFLDDVVMFSNSIEEHIDHLNVVFKAVGEAVITLKITKCTLLRQT